MYLIQQTESFEEWHESIKDLRAKVAIARRIERAENGNLGDVKLVGDAVSEISIDIGAGYRVYYTIREKSNDVFLAGGTKNPLQSDVKKAVQLAKEF